jgi:Flp pilus assembly pilin Flp
MLTQFFSLLQSFRMPTESGQDLAEYAVFIGLIALVVVISVTLIGGEISAVFVAIATAIQNGI